MRAMPAPHCPDAHRFGQVNTAAERGTWLVTAITAVTMAMELAAGWAYGSMALLADGWHMGSHAVALGLSALTYLVARRLANDWRFAFGTWKIEVLGAYTSALLMVGVAVAMVGGSVGRLIAPQPIQYTQAMAVGMLGLGVNLLCAWLLLRSDRPQAHPQSHSHGAEDTHEHGHDLNLRAAYLHVVADAATSVLALLALAGGAWRGWQWLDPLVGVLGAVLVGRWAWGLLRQTSAALLDREMDHPVVQHIRQALVSEGDNPSLELRDLHVWRVGANHYACALSVLGRAGHVEPANVRRALALVPQVVHATIEIHHPPR